MIRRHLPGHPKDICPKDWPLLCRDLLLYGDSRRLSNPTLAKSISEAWG